MKTYSTNKAVISRVMKALLALSFGASATVALAQTTDKPATDKATSADASKPQAAIKIGFVNTEKLLRESAPAKEAEAKIEEEFKKRDADLQKLANELRAKFENFDKNAPVMSDSERNKAQRELTDLDTDLQRKRREFQEDFNRRRNDAFATIVEKANTAIKEIAEKQDYDLILQDAVTVSPRVDVTDEVIKVLNSSNNAKK
ncbi:OmpH family outer membrane protein [Pelistega europaea]|nr:OmpH family outer membrane protein [Pelistega europaea]